MPVDYSVFADFKPDWVQAPLNFSLSALELASLMASRLCHDLISPVGAVNNAMELYEEGLGDAEALQLAQMSAASASARLQFARLAYGSAGSAGDAIGASAAETLTRDYLDKDKITLNWQADMPHISKDAAKFLLNLTVLAASAIPRGGQLDVLLARGPRRPRFCLRAQGALCRLPPPFAALYCGAMQKEEISAHNIQFYWTLLLSEHISMPLAIAQTGGGLCFIAE